MTSALAIELGVAGVWAGSVLYFHLRGRERLRFRRQLTDHSSFLAPYNALIQLCSALPKGPFFDPSRFPELAPLRESWKTIRDEALRLYEAGHVQASASHEDLGFQSFFHRGWKRFYLKWYGEPLPSARALCPRTVELVESVPSIHGAMFTLIEPRQRISAHRDPFAGSIRYHLGLITPNDDDCCIFVDGERRSWRDGEDFFFDETYVHRFQNLTDRPRLIFFADVERPIRFGPVRALNRWLIRHVLPITASRNQDDDPIGFANRVHPLVHRARQPLQRWAKRLKYGHRPSYEILRWGTLLALVGLALAAGSGWLR